MSKDRHGVAIGIERIGAQFYVSIKAVGRLTHDDYEAMAPMLEAAIVKVNQPKVKVLFDATDLEGWDLRGAWDDFKFGLSHQSDFDKVAVYGNQNWQEFAAKIGKWFISGEVKFFASYEEAVTWLKD